MGQKEKIVSIIDRELNRERKSFFTLAQANNILKESGEFTFKEINDQLLKALLEKGEIQHSYRTTTKPRQWYIFHSSVNLNKMQKIIEQRQIQKNTQKIRSVKTNSNFEYNDSWWDRPNLVDPRFSNRSIVKFWAIFLILFLIIIIGSVSSSSEDDFIQNLKAAKERRIKEQETKQWYEMMKAHPEAFERR